MKLSIRNDSLKLVDPEHDLLTWEPSIEALNECRRSTPFNSGKYCQNYVRLIVVDELDDRLLVCGTFASKPQCSWRSRNQIADVLDTFDGLGKCPQSPDTSLAYMSLDNGDYYFATSIDYSEHGIKPDYLIDRSIGPSNPIRTDQFNSNWLNEPTFVASIEIGSYVYFFIRETAIEYMNCGQV